MAGGRGSVILSSPEGTSSLFTPTWLRACPLRRLGKRGPEPLPPGPCSTSLLVYSWQEDSHSLQEGLGGAPRQGPRAVTSFLSPTHLREEARLCLFPLSRPKIRLDSGGCTACWGPKLQGPEPRSHPGLRKDAHGRLGSPIQNLGPRSPDVQVLGTLGSERRSLSGCWPNSFKRGEGSPSTSRSNRSPGDVPSPTRPPVLV